MVNLGHFSLNFSIIVKKHFSARPPKLFGLSGDCWVKRSKKFVCPLGAFLLKLSVTSILTQCSNTISFKKYIRKFGLFSELSQLSRWINCLGKLVILMVIHWEISRESFYWSCKEKTLALKFVKSLLLVIIQFCKKF